MLFEYLPNPLNPEPDGISVHPKPPGYGQLVTVFFDEQFPQPEEIRAKFIREQLQREVKVVIYFAASHALFRNESCARLLLARREHGNSPALAGAHVPNPVARLVQKRLGEIGLPVLNSRWPAGLEPEKNQRQFRFQVFSFGGFKSMGHLPDQVKFPRLDLSRLSWFPMTHDDPPRSKPRSLPPRRPGADQKLLPVEMIAS